MVQHLTGRLRWAALLAVLGTAQGAHADPATGEETALGGVGSWGGHRREERNVPLPRGASLRRARTLGLGTRQTAGRLLRAAPEPSWVEAARGRWTRDPVWPVEGGRFGRGFGFTRRERVELPHDGADIVAPVGAVVRAVADGIVAYSDNGIHGYGNCVLIVHRGGWVSLYAHNLRNTVQAGWRVTRGERIALVGSTGISRGPHLHFELRKDGHLRDPMAVLTRPGVTRSTTVPDPEVESTDRRATGPDVASLLRGRARALGSPRLLRHLMGHGASDDVLAAVAGRRFRNLLWPVRGGDPDRPFETRGHAIEIPAEPGAPVRAAADGLVVFAGHWPRLGNRVALLHPDGRVTIYASVGDISVELGEAVQRGEWIARASEDSGRTRSRVRFEVYEGGEARDPRPLLVGVPAP